MIPRIVDLHRQGFTPEISPGDFEEHVRSIENFFRDGDEERKEWDQAPISAAGLHLSPPAQTIDDLLKFHSDPQRTEGLSVAELLERGLNAWVPSWPELVSCIDQLAEIPAGKSDRAVVQEFRESLNAPRIMIVRVRFYQPSSSSLSQEFVCSTTQSLAELRDLFECHSAVPNPNSSESACLVVGSTLLDDMRNPENCRYSSTVTQWLARHPDQEPCEVKDMEAVSLSQLKISLGAHCWFIHKGDCRHLVVFSELRTARPAPDQSLPFCVYRASARIPLCGVCELVPSYWVTFEDKLAASSPFHWCRSCYESAHYNSKGDLIFSDFRVFPVQPSSKQ